MNTSTIQIDISLDKDRIPQGISWAASQSSADAKQDAKAMMVSFWDGKEKAALRIDLWTKEMKVDEMADFYYQTFMTMADSFDRATHDEVLVADIKNFARDFYARFRKHQEEKGKGHQHG